MYMFIEEKLLVRLCYLLRQNSLIYFDANLTVSNDFYLISGTDSELDSGIQEKEDFTDEESKASKVTARRHKSLK